MGEEGDYGTEKREKAGMIGWRERERRQRRIK